MTETQFQAFLAWAVDELAKAQVKAGAWTELHAKPLAERLIRTLLPSGRSSQGQYLYTVQRVPEGNSVGYAWLGARQEGGKRFGVLYQLTVFERFRRQGYGSAALKAVEEKAQKLGLGAVILEVFAHNEAARGLYRKAGYQERSLILGKPLR